MPNNENQSINFDWAKNPCVNWICQDSDGEWWAYQDKPVMADGAWIPSSNSYWDLIESKNPNPNWKETLTARPEN